MNKVRISYSLVFDADFLKNNTYYLMGQYMRNDKQQPLTEAMYHILLSVFEPLHGYRMKKSIETITNCRLILSSGTLYGALINLLNNELISKHSISEGKIEYVITKKGQKVFVEEIRRLKLLIQDKEIMKAL